MPGRARTLLVIIALAAAGLTGCAGPATPAPQGSATPGPATQTPPPTCPNLPGCGGAGTPPPNLHASPTPDIVEMLSVMVGDKAATYPATCAISEGTSVVVEGKDATGSATFSWVGKKMPEVSGTLGGVAFSAPGLSASISGMSAHSWSFSGTDSGSGKPVSGSAICK
jgi:hypothetical protein